MASKRNTDRLWQKQLALQVKLSAATDRALFDGLPGWKQADRVADIGCGTGHFLAQIANRYQKKHYLAVDRNPAFITSTRRKLRGRNLEAVCSEIASVELEPHSLDYAIARLVLQHLPELDGFFRKVSGAVKPGGYLLIMDAEDSLLRWSPSLPEVEKALRALSDFQKASGVGRNGWAEIEKAASRRGFKKVLAKKLSYTSRENQKKNLHDMFVTLGCLLRDQFQIPFDQKAYQLELRRWLETPGTTGQFGMRVILFKKIR